MGVCVVLAACVAMSRITLGAHSWNQVFIGVVMGILTVIALPFKNFEKYMLIGMRDRLVVKFGALYTVLTVIFSLIFYYTNKGLDRHGDEWRDVPECPGCQKDIISNQMKNSAQMLILGGLYIGVGLNYRLANSKNF